MRNLAIGLLALTVIVAVFGAVLAVVGLPSAFARIEREYEDFYGLVFLLSLCLAVSAYCVGGIVRAVRGSPEKVGALGYASSAVVFLLGTLMLVYTIPSEGDWFLMVPGLLITLCPIASLWLGRNHGVTHQVTVDSSR